MGRGASVQGSEIRGQRSVFSWQPRGELVTGREQSKETVSGKGNYPARLARREVERDENPRRIADLGRRNGERGILSAGCC